MDLHIKNVIFHSYVNVYQVYQRVTIHMRSTFQWPFQEPIFKAYVREYPYKIWPYMVQYLHFRILKFPL